VEEEITARSSAATTRALPFYALCRRFLASRESRNACILQHVNVVRDDDANAAHMFPSTVQKRVCFRHGFNSDNYFEGQFVRMAG
jgi:hypothetical protein